MEVLSVHQNVVTLSAIFTVIIVILSAIFFFLFTML